MTSLTRLSLVLLRVAIGWHFLFEGLEKLDSYFRGPVEGKTVWTSEHYLRESTGPFSGLFRAQAGGDPNEAALERLTVPPGEPAKLPPALEKDWKDYLDRFVAHYRFDPTSPSRVVPPEFAAVFMAAPQSPFPANLPWPALNRLGPAEQMLAKSLELAEAEALRWLLHGEREVTRSFSLINEKVKETTPARVEALRTRLKQLHEIDRYGMPGFGKDVWKKKLATLKDEINKARVELLAEVNGPMARAMDFASKHRLTVEQRTKGPLPAVSKGTLFWIDQITMWGVTAVGVCLLLGLFTRTACLGGAGFLLMFYLSMPALPWLPVNPRAEGHYLYINKNIIEMLALLALATTQSGCWVGLDGLIHTLLGRSEEERAARKATGKREGAPVASPAPAPSPLTPPFEALPVPPTSVKESPHGP